MNLGLWWKSLSDCTKGNIEPYLALQIPNEIIESEGKKNEPVEQ